MLEFYETYKGYDIWIEKDIEKGIFQYVYYKNNIPKPENKIVYDSIGEVHSVIAYMVHKKYLKKYSNDNNTNKR